MKAIQITLFAAFLVAVGGVCLAQEAQIFEPMPGPQELTPLPKVEISASENPVPVVEEPPTETVEVEVVAEPQQQQQIEEATRQVLTAPQQQVIVRSGLTREQVEKIADARIRESGALARGGVGAEFEKLAEEYGLISKSGAKALITKSIGDHGLVSESFVEKRDEKTSDQANAFSFLLSLITFLLVLVIGIWQIHRIRNWIDRLQSVRYYKYVCDLGTKANPRPTDELEWSNPDGTLSPGHRFKVKLEAYNLSRINAQPILFADVLDPRNQLVQEFGYLNIGDGKNIKIPNHVLLRLFEEGITLDQISGAPDKLPRRQVAYLRYCYQVPDAEPEEPQPEETEEEPAAPDPETEPPPIDDLPPPGSG